MTCVIAYKDKNTTYIASDNAGTDDDFNKENLNTEKIFKKDNILMGWCDSIRIGQLLHYKLKLPKIKRNQILQDYMVDLSETIREMYKKYDCAVAYTDGVTRCNEALFCINGKIFKLQSNYAMLDMKENFASIGCGEKYAVSALKILENDKVSKTISVEEKLKCVLETVSYFSAAVDGPYFYMTDKMKNPKLL